MNVPEVFGLKSYFRTFQSFNINQKIFFKLDGKCQNLCLSVSFDGAKTHHRKSHITLGKKRLCVCSNALECESVRKKVSARRWCEHKREREPSRQIDDFLSSIVVVFISLNSPRFYFSFLVSHSHEIEKFSGKNKCRWMNWILLD